MTEVLGDAFENEMKNYSTCDLYLAAMFITAGCKMGKSYRDTKTKRVYFIFEKSAIIEDLKIKYFGRDAKVDALSFSDNIKSLKSLCHNLMNNSSM